MSDVSKTNELIEEINKVLGKGDGQIGWAYMDELLVKAKIALEAATRVPVQGEPNDDREALLWNIEDRLKLLEAGAREPLIRQMAWTEDSTAEVLAIVDELRGWIAVLSRATVPDAATAHSPVHFECNCVPNLGPTHCHACSDEVGNPVIWSACPTRDERDAATERVQAELDEMAVRFSEYLCETTGGLLSKTGYDVSVMVNRAQEYYDRQAKEYHDDYCEKSEELEAERDAALAAVERVRALETFSITDSYPAWTAVDHDDLLAALDVAPDNESLPNHCQSCGAWGTTEVHLRGCSMTTDNRTNEPTEAMVKAAYLAHLKAPRTRGMDVYGPMRAALVAAQGAAPQAGRRPKHLLNQLNRIADALEEYELEGIAGDAPAWMRKAADYIETGRQWRAPLLPSSTVDEDALANLIYSTSVKNFGGLEPRVAPIIARAVAEWLKEQGR